METEIKMGPIDNITAQKMFSMFGDNITMLPSLTLECTYYDTEDFQLEKLQTALRLRKENGIGICTLKYPAEGTVHSREELSFEAAGISEGVNQLLSEDIPANIADILKMPLRAFGGNRSTRIRGIFMHGNFAAEISYDSGEIFAGELSDIIAECEAELLEGSAEELEKLAERICVFCGIKELHETKHGRTFALLKRTRK